METNTETKPWYLSKTLWIAIAQAVSGILTALFAQDPTLKAVGYLAIAKSIADFFVRLNTDKTIV